MGGMGRAHLHAPNKVKEEAACMRKVEVDYAEEVEPARCILDVVRVMIIFACPYHLATFYALLQGRVQILRVKNRFAEPVPGSEYRDVMLNVLFEHEGASQVVEMQLSLEILVALKRFQHKPYQVLRHDSLAQFVKTGVVFESPAVEVAV